MKSFVPLNLGFQHISRGVVLSNHQTVVATELLRNEPVQIVLIADGTCVTVRGTTTTCFDSTKDLIR
jgi:hypothetical protein